VERCGALLHLVDGTAEDVAENYRIVRAELDAYGDVLHDKTEVVALNKCDALQKETIAEKKAQLEHACNGPVRVISGVAGIGVEAMVNDLFDIVIEARLRELEQTGTNDYDDDDDEGDYAYEEDGEDDYEDDVEDGEE
jgi:GTP-binding protein